MSGDGMGDGRPSTPARAGIQAHIGRATRFAKTGNESKGRTRDWSIFMFFRILKRAEMAIFLNRISELGATAPLPEDPEPTGDIVRMRGENLAHAMANPSLFEFRASMPDSESVGGEEAAGDGKDPAEAAEAAPAEMAAPGPEHPAEEFLAWLSLLVDGDASRVGESVRRVTSALQRGEAAKTTLEIEALNEILNLVPESVKQIPFYKAMLHIRDAAKAIGGAAGSPEQAGSVALEQGLLGICVQDLLRQFTAGKEQGPSSLNDDAPEAPVKRSGIVRSEQIEPVGIVADKFDPAPINIAFTFKGLEALKLNENTLYTFPDVFREGMAARAGRLGDTGPSGPENWYGELGQPSVHGYFTGGFLIYTGNPHIPTGEGDWKKVREQVRNFNERTDEGQRLREAINLVYRLFGMEIVHIELGQDPYVAKPNGQIEKPAYRKEHFGFRDGLSQPFVDLGLGLPPPGGSVPSRDRTWAPAAPGEIFLGLSDEDGAVSLEPSHAGLRDGGTYIVFRKLAQDVAGFRNFLSLQRPDDPHAQDKLAAEMVGRWPGGASLIAAPDHELTGADLNDFLYVADDPKGERCPLSAHVRRANPRDIGGRDDVRRHRILRRSISYGGPFLPDGSTGDGEERGMLFIAANSRIDLQFEVVQADWLNGGEFLGQAGLARCPLTGANRGHARDTFLEAGKGVAITGVPGFVTTRGGDYFFMPGVDALREIAHGSDFAMDPRTNPEMLYRGYSFGDSKTRELFEEGRLRGYVERIIFRKEKSVRVEMPSSEWSPAAGAGSTGAPADAHISFIGTNDDAWDVLHGLDKTKKANFTVEHYATSSRRLTRNIEFIIGTDRKPEATWQARDRQKKMLEAAWREFDRMLQAGHKIGIYQRLGGIVNLALERSLARVSQSGRIDLIRDLPTEATYRISADFIGIPGPEGLTELSLSLPFAKRHVGELPQDWVRAMKGKAPDNPALLTLQIWSALIFAEVVGNVQMRRDLVGLASQAASEFFGHIDELVASASSYSLGRMPTLLDAFIAKAPTTNDADRQQYFTDARVLLAELSGSAVGIIPGVFGSVMETVMDNRIDLQRLTPVLERPIGAEKTGIPRFIYEITRLKPSIPLLMRRSRVETKLPSGAIIPKGDWVGVLISAAGLDDKYFKDPLRFSLHPWLPGPARPYDKYFLFGAKGGDRECWGRDHMALMVLQQCIRAASELKGLHRIAGANRSFEIFAGSKVGLRAKFSPFTYTGNLKT